MMFRGHFPSRFPARRRVPKTAPIEAMTMATAASTAPIRNAWAAPTPIPAGTATCLRMKVVRLFPVPTAYLIAVPTMWDAAALRGAAAAKEAPARARPTARRGCSAMQQTRASACACVFCQARNARSGRPATRLRRGEEALMAHVQIKMAFLRV